MSHALRHEPWVYEPELDEAGWVPVGELLDAVRGLGPAWEQVGRGDLVRMVASSSKRRHEIDGDRIRDGAKLGDLYVVTIRTRTGEVGPPCKNCRTWVPGE